VPLKEFPAPRSPRSAGTFVAVFLAATGFLFQHHHEGEHIALLAAIDGLKIHYTPLWQWLTNLRPIKLDFGLYFALRKLRIRSSPGSDRPADSTASDKLTTMQMTEY
jgi:hypothetical protein